MNRKVFLVSDGTGITVSSLSHSLLSQFEGLTFDQVSLPYTNTARKARHVAETIKTAMRDSVLPPIVFTTIVREDLLEIITATEAQVFDFLQTFIGPLEKTLGQESTHTMGRSHGVQDYEQYKRRIDALNFTLSTDDGSALTRYSSADLILVGVSRSGKTPTSLYLALHHSLAVANYPITEEDMDTASLPAPLQPHRHKLFGLTISIDRLAAIREERRPNSRYASPAQCAFEVKTVEKMFVSEHIPYLSATSLSIEELATKIISRSGW